MNSANSLLDRLLATYPDTPRGRAKQWIIAGRVALNGNVVRKPHQAVTDSAARVELLDRRESMLQLGSGWVIHPRVTLLHLDSSLAVVNKGAGLISVPAPNAEISALSILTDFLAGRLRAQDRRIAAKTLPAPWRRLTPLPVHRLDQYTSGIFCMALNQRARAHLIEQLKAHTMTREYVAFVEGRPAATKGTWRNWLQLSKDEMRQNVLSGDASEPEAGNEASAPLPLTAAKGRTRQSSRSDSGAVEAVTHYEIVREYSLSHGKGVVTQLRLRLETGRKHQIRAQAANAGLPLVGDRTYNRNHRAELKATIEFSRQALHAEILELEHPEQPGKRSKWRAEWPKDLRELERGLRGMEQTR